MKYILLFLLPLSSLATTYYPATIDEANRLALVKGDSVLFSYGVTYYGSLQAKPGVVYASYNGGRARLSGFTSIKKWSAIGNGIYESVEALPLASATMVLVNNQQAAMGRYPNGKDNWVYAEAVTGTMPVTIHHIGAPLPANFAGAHIVMRKMHWIVDHNLVVSNNVHDSAILVYTELPGSTTRQPFKKQFGFFIENHPATLDSIGEWYYNPATKKLRVYFGSKILPVRVATVQHVVTAQTGAVVRNLTIEGSNDNLVNVVGDNVTLRSCVVQYSGRSGISVDYNIRQGLKVLSSTIRFINDVGIYTDWRGGDSVTILSNTISDVGLIPGTGGWGDIGQEAIRTSGSFSLIEDNNIKRIGYTGIRFGDKLNNRVQFNVIDSVCMTKDDGSAIYAYRGASTAPASGNLVYRNIISNAIGNPYGTDVWKSGRRDAYGIYMDENAAGVTISENTITKCAKGIFNNRPNDIRYLKNTVFNCSESMILWRASTNYVIKNMEFIGNIYSAEPGTWRATAQWWETTGQNTIPSWGRSDSNYYVSAYSNSIVGSAPTFSDWKNHTLSEWQTSSKYGNKDAHSTYVQTSRVQRLEINATNATKTVTLSKRYKDVRGNIMPLTIAIQPYSSILLIEY